MKVRIKVRPTGYVSIDGADLTVWPKVDTVVDLPDVVAEDLIKSGHAEKARPLAKAEPMSEPKPSEPPATEPPVETRPAPPVEEKRPGRPPAVKKVPSAGA